MRKNDKYKVDVRVHSQEREWLRSLGGGDIVEGAQNLIRQLLERGEDNYGDLKFKRGFFGKQRRN
jgi:hypothetical protein